MNFHIVIYSFVFMLIIVDFNKSFIEISALTKKQTATTSLESQANDGKYYVSGTGNNNNTGTFLSPFLTIQKGLDVAIAGDTVFVKAGTYQENVTFRRSGTAKHPIVLKNYGRGLVTVDGQSSREYCIGIANKSYISVDGINVKNSTAYNVAIEGTDNVILKNFNSVLPFNSTVYNVLLSHHLFKVATTNVLVQNVTTYGGLHGIMIAGVNGAKIMGGEYTNAKVDGVSFTGNGDFPRNILIDGVNSHHNGRQGIGTANCNNVTIRNCWSHHNAASGIQIEANSDTTLLEDNICEYNCRGGGYANSDYEAGIWVYASDSSIVRRNTIKGNQTGLRFGRSTKIHAYQNLIIDNNYQPSTFPETQNTSGVDFMESSGTFYNNVLVGNGAPDSKLGSLYIYPAGVCSLVIKNNIIMNDGSAKDIDFDQSYGSIIISDYNLVYNANRAVNIQLGIINRTWNVYKSATGRDAHSISANPLFVGPADYHLQSASPAIDAGDDVGLTTDYSGNPMTGMPDIGAYEYSVAHPPQKVH